MDYVSGPEIIFYFFSLGAISILSILFLYCCTKPSNSTLCSRWSCPCEGITKNIELTLHLPLLWDQNQKNMRLFYSVCIFFHNFRSGESVFHIYIVFLLIFISMITNWVLYGLTNRVILSKIGIFSHKSVNMVFNR